MRYIAIFALTLVLGGGVFLLTRSSAQPDPLVYQQRLWEQQQQQARQTALEPFQRASTAAWYLFVAVAPLVALGFAVDAWMQRRRPLVYPNAQGQLPVPRAVVDSGELAGAMLAALQQFHHTQQLAAVQPRVDKLSITAREPAAFPQIPLNAPCLTTAQPEAPALPTGTVDLADLTVNWRPSVQSITLAVGPGGQPYRVHAKDLCHVALAGATGGGKSNIMRLLLAQLVSAGAHVVLADPHYTPLDAESGDDWRPIAQRLHMAPAVKASDIQHMLAWLAADELPQRLERRYKGQPIGAPLFLAIDELPSIVKDIPEAPEHMGRLLREARKVGIFIIGAAQDFLVKTIGGAGAVRDCYRTSYYVGGDAQTARVLLDVQGRVDDGQLGQGLAMLRSKVTPTASLVRVPLASNAAIYGLLGDANQDAAINVTPSDGRPDGSQMAANAQVDVTALQRPTPHTAEAERVLTLFRQGLDVAGVVREIYGVTSKQGRTYQERSAEVQAVLRGAL